VQIHSALHVSFDVFMHLIVKVPYLTQTWDLDSYLWSDNQKKNLVFHLSKFKHRNIGKKTVDKFLSKLPFKAICRLVKIQIVVGTLMHLIPTLILLTTLKTLINDFYFSSFIFGVFYSSSLKCKVWEKSEKVSNLRQILNGIKIELTL